MGKIVKIKDSQLEIREVEIRVPGGVIGIATGYGLDGPGIESRWGTRFSAPV
jgi:hypothetical protein